MSISNLQLANQLLDSDAGRAVYDALIQANIDLRFVSLELVKDMLNAEHHQRHRMGWPNSQCCHSASV
ncbi:MAG: hypothetical protein WKF77_13245 [Planctomycetaceae bacterium]